MRHSLSYRSGTKSGTPSLLVLRLCAHEGRPCNFVCSQPCTLTASCINGPVQIKQSLVFTFGLRDSTADIRELISCYIPFASRSATSNHKFLAGFGVKADGPVEEALTCVYRSSVLADLCSAKCAKFRSYIRLNTDGLVLDALSS